MFTLQRSVMVLAGVSVLGVTGQHFVNPGVKINGKYYRKTPQKEELLPDMHNISKYFIFQQDSAPDHRAKETVDPVDYKVWSVLQEQLYKVKAKSDSVFDALHSNVHYFQTKVSIIQALFKLQ